MNMKCTVFTKKVNLLITGIYIEGLRCGIQNWENHIKIQQGKWLLLRLKKGIGIKMKISDKEQASKHVIVNVIV